MQVAVVSESGSRTYSPWQSRQQKLILGIIPTLYYSSRPLMHFLSHFIIFSMKNKIRCCKKEITWLYIRGFRTSAHRSATACLDEGACAKRATRAPGKAWHCRNVFFTLTLRLIYTKYIQKHTHIRKLWTQIHTLRNSINTSKHADTNYTLTYSY